MKYYSLVICLLLAVVIHSQADPRLSSWYTERSGAYARIYETLADETNQNAVSTWNRGAGVQNSPTYSGIHEISYTDDWIYIRTTNLASHFMGPWYLNAAKTNLFPNYPSNQAVLYRLPRNPVDPTTVNSKTLTGGGPIGYFVNGVSMFDSRDAFSYRSNTGTEVNGPQGDGAWNRDAYVNEGVTFDAGNAHQAMGRYHYHANPPALRYQLRDSVDFDEETNTYSENFNGQHSPILAWSRDGLPIYGPYGFSDPLDSSSEVRRMRSGFQIRTDIASNGSPRIAWPAWATRIYAGIRSFANGPNVSSTYSLGRYMEDNDYLGDLGQTLSVDFDLNEYNVRFCVTPEYPEGNWSYFVCIDEAGTPIFPYNIGRAFFGDPVGNNANGIPDSDESGATVSTLFEGGPESPSVIQSIFIENPADNEVTLLWSGVEGATYEVQVSTDLGKTDAWEGLGPQVVADSNSVSYSYSSGGDRPERLFYQASQINLASFDDNGFDFEETSPPDIEGDLSSLTVSLSGGPADLNVLPTSLTFNGQAIDISNANVSRPSQAEITFDFPTKDLASGDYTLSATYSGEPPRNGIYTIPVNILLLIVDDWGLDASPLDNTVQGAHLANMPNLQKLADEGLRFTRAYSQPTCSPMRATMLTGRQPFQHNVGTPQNANAFSATVNEITLPEIFATMGAPHDLLAVGKWHLGGGDTGYSVRGGWPEFYGMNGGGVQDYYSWSKNSNGSVATSTTYSTTDLVNHVSSFVGGKEAAGTPWLAWVAFNAPHTPFHDPPAELAPEGGYSAQEAGESSNSHQYRKALEALDTEIGRLLESINPARTQIILLGDNGTPGQVVQAPFGNGNAKGDLYNGGIHVSMVAKGPAVKVAPGSTTDTLVHCIDVFSTILELAGIDESAVPDLAARNIGSTSMVPIFNGTDSADRFVIAERFGNNPGRAVIVADYPDYKYIIYGDPRSAADAPTFEFFNIGAPANDFNEQVPMDIGSLTGTALDAYNACVAKDNEVGGGYSD
ncbi:MAG: sulfatase-like hydrolase/transferase [Verrucomicrobia bacterium]|nr:sulfatase-like hydrolase/transferase [Verrucomicrobiota bacterium]